MDYYKDYYKDYKALRLAFAELLVNLKGWRFDINGNYKLCAKEAKTILQVNDLLCALDGTKDLDNENECDGR